MSLWRLAFGLGLAGAYAAASYFLMLHAPGAPWAVAVILGPLVGGLTIWALQRRNVPTLAVGGVALVALIILVARGGLGDVQRLYLAQHAGIHLTLAWTFGISLRSGRLSLVGLLADRAHGPLTSTQVEYTRRVTAVWATYFAMMVLLSFALFAGAEWSTWSFFANVATPVSALAIFTGEHRIRYVLHPEFERRPLLDGVMAYRRVAPSSAAGIADAR